MSSYEELAGNWLNSSLRGVFVLNSLDLFFWRFHKFIFEIRPAFIDKPKALKNYYLEFCWILAKMKIV